MGTGFVKDNSSPFPWIEKSPGATLDYGFEWNAAGDSWLAGDSISSATWTVPAGLTKAAEAVTGSVTTVWLAGGTSGAKYQVSCTIVTGAGRQETRTFEIRVRTR